VHCLAEAVTVPRWRADAALREGRPAAGRITAAMVFSDAGTRFFAGVKDFTFIRKAFSYNSKIRGIFRTSGAMGRVEEMATEKATILLNQAIEAFLLEGSIEQRLWGGERLCQEIRRLQGGNLRRTR
jgi:hypothetical protein